MTFLSPEEKIRTPGEPSLPSMSARVLIIGGSGQVGTRLRAGLASSGTLHAGTAASCPFPGSLDLDLRSSASVERCICSFAPTHVVLSAALANVDGCEQRRDEARDINVEGTRRVVKACVSAGARLCFLSTDYVFDGKNGPYRESDAPNPVNEYGRLKLEAESIVLSSEGLVVRTTVVYDWMPTSKNFLMSLSARLSRGEVVQVPNDQWGHPTYAPNLADAVKRLHLNGAAGVYHVVGPDYVNRYQFAVSAAAAFGLDSGLIHPISTAKLRQPAVRPLRAGLITDKFRTAYPDFRLMGVKEGLSAAAASRKELQS